MDDDLTLLDDQAFLAERQRVREALEALNERYRRLNSEFDRRAGATWESASQR
jgi:hypothetical protein